MRHYKVVSRIIGDEVIGTQARRSSCWED